MHCQPHKVKSSNNECSLLINGNGNEVTPWSQSLARGGNEGERGSMLENIIFCGSYW